MRQRTAALLALVLCVLGVSTASAQTGQKHALLVGISRYPAVPLEGPAKDVAALQKMLVERWGFPAANVHTVLDAAATRAGVLAALDNVVATTKPGDFVFLYFSGHGTSNFDPEFKDVGIDGGSGALIPVDVKIGPLEQIKATLLIGSRDIRPRLEKLDVDRKVFVAFDSCYSGNSARSLFAAGQPRYIPISTLTGGTSASRSLGGKANFEEDSGSSFGAQTAAQGAAWPYKNTLYFSASSKAEQAQDITSADLQSGRRKTVDGQPHGAFSNALLEGLGGNADTNHDQAISYSELYQYIKDTVTKSFPHQPQLLAPEGQPALLAAPIFAGARSIAPPAVAAAAPPPAGGLRVRTENVSAALVTAIASTPGVRVMPAGGAYDVLVSQTPQAMIGQRATRWPTS